MRELNFGMSALSGSVVGADAAADVAGAIQQAPDALSLAWLVNAAPEVLVPRKISADWSSLRHLLLHRGRV